MIKQSDKILCPKCGSPDWSCWDEQQLYSHDEENDDLYQSGVIAYLRCRDCNNIYENREGEGQTREEFGRTFYHE